MLKRTHVPQCLGIGHPIKVRCVSIGQAFRESLLCVVQTALPVLHNALGNPDEKPRIGELLRGWHRYRLEQTLGKKIIKIDLNVIVLERDRYGPRILKAGSIRRFLDLVLQNRYLRANSQRPSFLKKREEIGAICNNLFKWPVLKLTALPKHLDEPTNHPRRNIFFAVMLSQ